MNFFNIFPLIFILLIFNKLYSEEVKFQWPIDIYNKQYLITSTFGESRLDHFHAGIDIAGENVSIYPVQDGKLLYLDFSSMNFYKRFPSGTGNQVWIEHEKGYWSGYYHLNKFFLPDNKIYISKNESIALSGNTGRSRGAHLHFFILENYGEKIINPLLLLSKEEDTFPPIIEYLAFVIQENKKENITIIKPKIENFVRLTKPRPIFLKATDPGSTKNTRRIPYKIEYIFKNEETTEENSLQFDYLKNSNDGLNLRENGKFEDVYYKDFIKLKVFPFKQGINQIIVNAYDFNLNKTTEIFILNVKKEY